MEGTRCNVASEKKQITGLSRMWNVINEVKQLEGELAKQLKINN